MKGDLSLYVIAGSSLAAGRPLAEVVAAALTGGATAVQLREKETTDRAAYAAGLAVREAARAAGALFIVNDRVDLAMALGADGVHVGQDDLPVAVVRLLLGPEAVIGVSVETPEEAVLAEKAGADYLGTGPVYATGTKPDAGTPYGPAVVGRIKAATRLPVVAVGGITAANAAPVVAAGADGLAVASAVIGAADPVAAAAAFRRLLNPNHD